MGGRSATDDPKGSDDKGPQTQTDTPWKQPVEKEQGSGDAKPDLEKWNDSKTH